MTACSVRFCHRSRASCSHAWANLSRMAALARAGFASDANRACWRMVGRQQYFRTGVSRRDVRVQRRACHHACRQLGYHLQRLPLPAIASSSLVVGVSPAHALTGSLLSCDAGEVATDAFCSKTPPPNRPPAALLRRSPHRGSMNSSTGSVASSTVRSSSSSSSSSAAAAPAANRFVIRDDYLSPFRLAADAADAPGCAVSACGCE